TWHERFADARERGEWFGPVPELLLAIMEAKVSQLEAENARLQASLDAERERAREVRSSLGQLWASARGKPIPIRYGVLSSDLGPATVSPLEAENARLEAELQAALDSRIRLTTAIRNISRILEGPAVQPVQPVDSLPRVSTAKPGGTS